MSHMSQYMRTQQPPGSNYPRKPRDCRKIRITLVNRRFELRRRDTRPRVLHSNLSLAAAFNDTSQRLQRWSPRSEFLSRLRAPLIR